MILLNNLNTCDWNHVMDTDNAQEAYTKFSQTPQSIYDRCFPKYVVKNDMIIRSLGFQVL